MRQAHAIIDTRKAWRFVSRPKREINARTPIPYGRVDGTKTSSKAVFKRF
jgi:hypothetical protein